MPKSVFGDEAGFTGDDLTDKPQPYFVYACVVVEPEEATRILLHLRDLLGTKAPEFKGSKLFAHSRALEAVQYLADSLAGRAGLVWHNKAYALACKFYEYALEPAISAGNNAFYESDFHRFIANALYVFVQTGDQDAETVFTNFLQLMRRKPGQDIEGIYARSLPWSQDPDSIMTDIIRLATSAPVAGAVQAELATISNPDGHIKGILDLSVTSVVSVLRSLSKAHGKLRVTLDDSKPLANAVRILNELGHRPLVMMPPELTEPLNYQLEGSIEFSDSKRSPGIQVADLIAGVFNAALKADSPKGRSLLTTLLPLTCQGCVVPALETVNLATPESVRNACILRELVQKAEAGYPLI